MFETNSGIPPRPPFQKTHTHTHTHGHTVPLYPLYRNGSLDRGVDTQDARVVVGAHEILSLLLFDLKLRINRWVCKDCPHWLILYVQSKGP